MSRRCLVEIRSYHLKPGTSDAFHALFVGQALPLVRASGMDIVAYGRSAHAVDAYYLIRAYVDLVHRQASQDAFYGSDAWRTGPRAAVLALIDSYLDTVLWLAPESVDDLRANVER